MLRAIEVGALAVVIAFLAAWAYSIMRPQPDLDVSPVTSGLTRYHPEAGERLTGLPPSYQRYTR